MGGRVTTPRYDPDNPLLAALDLVSASARPWEFAGRLRSLMAEAPESANETLSLENQILHLQAMVVWRGGERRFLPEFEYADGTSWPDPGALSHPDVVAYIRGRLRAARHPTLRARYGDLLWELSSDHTAARTAAECYQLSAAALLSGGENSFGADALARAVDLALRLDDASLAGAAVAALMRYLDQAAARSEDNMSSWLAEALLAVRRAADREQLQRAAQVIEALARALAQESPGAFPAEDLYRKAAQLHHASGESEREDAALRQVAACLEARARSSEEHSHMRAAHFYGEAEAAYQRVNDRPKVEGMRAKIREQSELAEQYEFREVRTPVPWPMEEIDEWVAELRRHPLDESLAVLSGHPTFAPSLQRAESDWREIAQTAVLQQFVTPTVQRGGLPVWRAADPQEILEYNVRQTLFQHSSLDATLVCHVLRGLLADAPSPARSLADWLLGNAFYVGTDVGVLRYGLERYFDGDWVGTLHVLPQYIENLLRLVLPKLGLIPFAEVQRRPGTFREKSITAVLQTEELRRGLGEDMCTHIEMVLTDPRGPQLRHMAAHGLLRAASCNSGVCDLVVHLLLLLARYSVGPRAGGQSAPSDGAAV
jgi:hypothetical protein